MEKNQYEEQEKKEDTKKEYENTILNRIEGKTNKIRNKLKFATLNIQGINSLGKRQEIERWMKKKKNRPAMHTGDKSQL